MSFGVMGGDMQPQGHLQTVVRMLGYGQQPQAACDAPRWKVNRDFTLDVEATMHRATVDGWPHAAIRSSRSTILTWISVRGSSSGVSIATIASVATWPRATAGATVWRPVSDGFPAAFAGMSCFAGGRMAARFVAASRITARAQAV